MNCWDLNSLTLKELEELSHLQKALSISLEKAIEIWSKENPGKIRNLGSFKNGEFESNEITKDGVKTRKGKEGLVHMIEELIKRKDK